MKNKNDLAVKLTRVSKIYQLHHEKPTLMENIFKKGRREKFVALDNIDLEVKRGDKLGIIGANGSGKTTLLKIITGIATPNFGKVQTWGKLVSLIDLNAGFHPELTGIENVYQNAMLLGMSRQETKRSMGEIISFAGIGGFIDAPMYSYSAGMQLRLGFAVALAAKPEILVLDESVMVGDQSFRQRVKERIMSFYESGITVIMVSHWLGYLRENCQHILWLEKGRVVSVGGFELLEKYEKSKSKNI